MTWVDPVKDGDVVVIEGPGHMGMATIVAARAAGASSVIVTGTSNDRFRLDCALRIGADHVIDVETEDRRGAGTRDHERRRWRTSYSTPPREVRSPSTWPWTSFARAVRVVDRRDEGPAARGVPQRLDPDPRGSPCTPVPGSTPSGLSP